MGEWMLCAVLGIGSIQDIKRKKVGLAVILAGVAGAVCIWKFDLKNEIVFKEFLMGAVPGMAMAILAIISKQAVGLGDALMVIVMGLYTGMKQMWAELIAACMLAMAAALVLIIIFKKGKKYELPFLPFLLAAHLIMLCV